MSFDFNEKTYYYLANFGRSFRFMLKLKNNKIFAKMLGTRRDWNFFYIRLNEFLNWSQHHYSQKSYSNIILSKILIQTREGNHVLNLIYNFGRCDSNNL